MVYVRFGFTIIYNQTVQHYFIFQTWWRDSLEMKASHIPNVLLSDLIWLLNLHRFSRKVGKQPLLSKTDPKICQVDSVEYELLRVFPKQRHVFPHSPLLSTPRNKPRDSWKLCCGRGMAGWQTSTARDTLLGIHAWECRKLYVISLTVELFHFSFV